MSTENLPVIQLDAPSSQTLPSSGGGFRNDGGIAVAPATARAMSAEIRVEAPVTAPAPAPQAPSPVEAPPAVYEAPGRGSMPKGLPVPAENPTLADAVERALAGLEAPGEPVAPVKPSAPAPAPGEAPAADAPKADKADEADPTAALTTEPDVDTTNWTPQAARAFERVKGQRKQLLSETEQLKTQIAAYEAQMNELKGSLVGSDSVEQLQARVREFEQQQMFTNLEGTRAYQEAIAKPLQDRMNLIDAVAERAGVKGDLLFDIIVAPEDPNNLPETDADGFPYQTKDQRIEALLAKASPRDKAAVFVTINEMDQLMAKRAAMFQNADQAYREARELEAQQAQVAAAAEAKHRRTVSMAVVDRIAERVPFLQEVEGLDLAKVKEEVAATNPAVLHPVDAQYHAATAKLFPFVVNDLMKAQREIEGLVAKLASYEDAEPGAGVGSSSGFTGGGVRGSVPYGNNTDNLTLAQVVERELANHRG
jgi:DedD protein